MATSAEQTASAPGARGLLGYFVGAYALTYLFWIPAALTETGQLTLPVPSFVFLVLGGLGPMLAAIVVTGMESGLPGVRRLFGQLKRWRVSPGWYAMALLGVPLIGLVAGGVHVALGGTLALGNLSGLLVSIPIQFVFVALIGGGLDEEMGRLLRCTQGRCLDFLG